MVAVVIFCIVKSVGMEEDNIFVHRFNVVISADVENTLALGAIVELEVIMD